MASVFTKDDERILKVNVALTKIREVLEQEGDVNERAIAKINEVLEAVKQIALP